MRRRDFLKAISAAPFLTAAPCLAQSRGVLVNDAHTGLNPTWVERVERPSSVAEIQKMLKDCRKHGKQVSLCGSRHATGGQQFAAKSVLLDLRGMNRVLQFDDKTGILSVESGIEWEQGEERRLIVSHRLYPMHCAAVDDPIPIFVVAGGEVRGSGTYYPA